jgi:hypothetical protein
MKRRQQEAGQEAGGEGAPGALGRPGAESTKGLCSAGLCGLMAAQRFSFRNRTAWSAAQLAPESLGEACLPAKPHQARKAPAGAA